MKHEEHHRPDDHHYNLHSLHKNSTSKIVKMKSLSALIPSSKTQQPKVYKVKPIHFRELVQKLTGAQPPDIQQPPQSQPQPRQRTNLQRVVPPPLPIRHPHQLQLQLQLQTQTDTKPSRKVEPEDDPELYSDNKVQNGVGTTELILSPNFQAWFAFAMMSPRTATLAQVEQR